MKTRNGATPASSARISVHSRLAGTVFFLLATAAAHGQPEEATSVERVRVVGERVYPVVDSVSPDTAGAVDAAEILRQLPGANLNANGALSGIAQYRGLFGDRVAVSVDGLGLVSGGPNAMDTPLSYASPLLLSHLSLERGIASVATATESLGGHLVVDFDRGQHREARGFALAGKVLARYADNGDARNTAFQLVGADDTHKVALLGQLDEAGDYAYPGGSVLPTRLERERLDLSYAYRNESTEARAFVGSLETKNTGTPSLPMDIRTIETDLYGLGFRRELGDRVSLDAALGYSDVFHVMDNFGLRTLPASPMDYRSTTAVGDGYEWRIGAHWLAGEATWQFGLDGQTAEHTATITNPNVVPFRIENFNAASRNVAGLFAQWNRQKGRLDLEAGLRLNHIETDSASVSASIPAMNPMMQMMGMNAAALAAAFNASRLDRSHDNVDVVFKLGRTLNAMRNVYVEVARKTRAPSYQELYLWLPLQSTGGLADGRSYIGNAALRSEVSREINLGSNWQGRKAWFAPQIFYKDIADYIQGVPSSNATANAVAVMMTGRPALEFANTDAEIYGLDLAWGYYLADRLVLEGVLTHARGRRTDVPDDLYRLAPLNGRVGLSYETANWLARLEVLAVAAQTRTSAYNDEPRTAGYATVNLGVQWEATAGVLVSAMATNLLDKRFQDHLAGINRVAGADILQGERLYGPGRSLQAGVRYSW